MHRSHVAVAGLNQVMAGQSPSCRRHTKRHEYWICECSTDHDSCRCKRQNPAPRQTIPKANPSIRLKRCTRQELEYRTLMKMTYYSSKEAEYIRETTA